MLLRHTHRPGTRIWCRYDSIDLAYQTRLPTSARPALDSSNAQLSLILSELVESSSKLLGKKSNTRRDGICQALERRAWARGLRDEA